MRPGEFEPALAAFEAMMKFRLGDENQAAARRDVIARTSMMFPGFEASLAQYEAERREGVEKIVIDGGVLRRDGGKKQWYGGSLASHGAWPEYRERLEAGGLPQKAISAIDDSTERILSLSANPKTPGDKRKGLVIGYVQSGKTANFTGLIAKAVDAGYRIVIVLAGLYSNLRVQTQLRLQADLAVDDVRDSSGIAWYRLTSATADIGRDNSPGLFNSTANVAVLVVKKHEMRLSNVQTFLESVPAETLKKRGVLIIDDESDQATPNTLGRKGLVSTINQRIRDIWKAVPTGTYVAYTATPFANVFIDPSDEHDLYPDDFITVLPKPDLYMGSELFFDVKQDADDAGDEPIRQLSHEVPEHEAQVFTPKPKAVGEFAPHMTPTLDSAIRWFILATAIREIRTGQAKNSSMLVHTSQRVAVHQLTKDVITRFINELSFDAESQESAFKAVFDVERDRATSLRDGEPMPSWDEIWTLAQSVLQSTFVKIDNGESTDRLVYTPGEPQTVIAVGGGTLSRGLTLEGLVVSYFLRSSNSYDTLLQMGRWFGFRPGYRDLVRVWMGPGLEDDYGHLARVESQLRDEVRIMEGEGKTPREFAVKVRSHPGRLEITSAGKMSAADLVKAGLGGTRRQTIYLDRSPKSIVAQREASRRLVSRVQSHGGPALERLSRGTSGPPSLLLPGLTHADIVQFLREYWVSPTERWLQAGAMESWLREHGANTEWSLVLVSGPAAGGRVVELPGGLSVGVSSRAPLNADNWSPDRLKTDIPDGSDVVNIRALMSADDYLLDLRILADQKSENFSSEEREILGAARKGDMKQMRAVRSEIRPDSGALLLYAVDGDSQPESSSSTRGPMGASGPLVGLGVVFPSVETEDPGEYWAAGLQDVGADDEEVAHVRDDEADYSPGDAR